MAGALDGVVVLDLTGRFWSSLGVAILADFGARTIRLDDPNAPRERDDERDPGDSWNSRHELANRNKLSIALDHTSNAGRAALERLIERADVFATDRPAAELREQRLDYESVAALRPDVIYARGSGFGPKGPDSDLPALDELAAARTGMMPILPQPGQPPVYTGSGQIYTSVMLAFGVVAALRHRQQTGEGQEVDVSLFAGNMYGASLDLQAYLAMGGERFLHPVSRLDAGNPMSGVMYMTRDDRWITLTMPDTDRYWPAFSKIAGIDEHDERFDSHERRCEANRLELLQVLDDAFRREPAAHWRRTFDELQLSADVIEEYAFPADDAAARRNRYVLNLEHPAAGAVQTLGFPVMMSDSTPHLSRTAPWRGQHSTELLSELLGYSEREIADLEAAGAIG